MLDRFCWVKIQAHLGYTGANTGAYTGTYKQARSRIQAFWRLLCPPLLFKHFGSSKINRLRVQYLFNTGI